MKKSTWIVLAVVGGLLVLVMLIGTAAIALLAIVGTGDDYIKMIDSYAELDETMDGRFYLPPEATLPDCTHTYIAYYPTRFSNTPEGYSIYYDTDDIWGSLSVNALTLDALAYDAHEELTANDSYNTVPLDVNEYGVCFILHEVFYYIACIDDPDDPGDDDDALALTMAVTQSIIDQLDVAM